MRRTRTFRPSDMGGVSHWLSVSRTRCSTRTSTTTAPQRTRPTRGSRSISRRSVDASGANVLPTGQERWVATSAPLTTVATYGRAGSSSRVRIYDWITHLGLTTTNYDYLGTPNLFGRTVIANWKRIAAAEARIRVAGRSRRIANLLMS